MRDIDASYVSAPKRLAAAASATAVGAGQGGGRAATVPAAGLLTGSAGRPIRLVLRDTARLARLARLHEYIYECVSFAGARPERRRFIIITINSLFMRSSFGFRVKG